MDYIIFTCTCTYAYYFIIHSLPTLLTEGMETPEFWSLLDGKTDYSHYSIKNEVR